MGLLGLGDVPQEIILQAGRDGAGLVPAEPAPRWASLQEQEPGPGERRCIYTASRHRQGICLLLCGCK